MEQSILDTLGDVEQVANLLKGTFVPRKN